MKLENVVIVLFCFIAIIICAVAAGAVTLFELNTIRPVPPAVNAEGLCWPVQAEVKEAEGPAYVLYYTPEDAETIAKAVWGEARGCSTEGQTRVVWCILNRVDDSRFPDTIQGVVTQPCQFYGYSPDYPVTPEILAVVNDVLYRWNLEKNGVAVARELSPEHLYFTGDGAQNHFRTVY
mgnify:CR=1 FL=1